MLLRTDPFRDVDRLAQVAFGGGRPSAMPMDAYRLGDEFVLEIDLPGVDPASIDLSVEKDVLTVHAERTRPAHEGTEQLIAERPHGTFRRQLFLGNALDTERIQAQYRDGVLIVTLPVAERAKPRRIDVSTAGSSTTTTTAAELETSS
jgi:HSP20 family protein